MARTVGVVIPAYRPDVDRLRRYLDDLVRVVDPAVLRIELDAPTAETRRALAAAPGTVSAVSERRGKGAAISAGFDALDTDVLAFVDADGSTPAPSVADVVDAVPEADVAVGSRRHPEATLRATQTVGRRSLGDVFAWTARRLVEPSLYDYQCGAKALAAPAWRRTRAFVTEPGFAWDLEVVTMAHALGHEVREVPVTWEDYPGSTVDPLSTALELARTLASVRHRQRTLAGSRLHELVGEGRRDLLATTEANSRVDRPGE
jgi:glycosyltransferase involved in cell wall biosynthesis